MNEIFEIYKDFCDMPHKCSERKAEILSQYVESIDLPRKKKKAVRKHLVIEYQIMCYGEELLKSYFDL